MVFVLLLYYYYCFICYIFLGLFIIRFKLGIAFSICKVTSCETACKTLNYCFQQLPQTPTIIVFSFKNFDGLLSDLWMMHFVTIVDILLDENISTNNIFHHILRFRSFFCQLVVIYMPLLWLVSFFCLDFPLILQTTGVYSTSQELWSMLHQGMIQHMTACGLGLTNNWPHPPVK